MQAPSTESPGFLAGGGEMGALIRAKDWSTTPLGPLETWPQSLRTSVGICLHSRFPMVILWGPDLILIYNDAYQQLIGAIHPRALGNKGREVWAEIWDTIGPMLNDVLTRGEAIRSENQLFTLDRHGYPEECYFTFSYSPVYDEQGDIGGVFTVINETTQSELNERQLRSLFGQAPVAIAILRGPEFVIELANDEQLRMWGRAAGQVLNKPHFEALPELAQPEFIAVLNGVYTGGEALKLTELPAPLHRDGRTEIGYFSPHFQPLRGGDGRVSGIIVVTNEVTTQVLARRKIEESEQRLQSTLQQTPVPISIVGREPDFAYQLANDAFVELVDRPLDRILGKPLAEAMPEVIGQGYEALLEQVATTGAPYVVHEAPVNLVRGGQQQTMFFDIQYHPMRDPGGTITGVMGLSVDVTAQVVARRRIEDSERLLRDVFEQAPTAIGMFRGPDFIIELANPRVCQFWGRTQAEVLGKPLFEALPEAAGQGFEELLTGVLQTGRPFVGTELPVTLHRNGQLETVYFDFAYHPYPNADGTVDRIILVAEEITKRMQARQVLEEDQQRLKSLFRQAPVGIAILRGPQHTFELANDFYVNFVGRRRAEELMGKPLLEALPEIEGQGFSELLTQVVQTGEPVVFTDQPVRLVRNGQLETGYFNFTYQPLPTPESGVLVIAVEVTDSVLARQKIEESESRFRQLADAMPQMVWSTLPDGYHDFYNQRWYDFTGLSYEQTKAEGWANVLHPDDYDRTWAVWRESLETGKTYEIEYRMRRCDGEYVWQLGRALPIRDESPDGQPGAIARWYGTCTDISEQKRAEQALRESEEKYRALFESMDEGFCIIEFLDGPHGPLSDYVHVEANPAYGRHAGIPDVVGQRLRNLVPDEADDWIARYRPVLETGRPTHFEQTLVATGRNLELAAFRIEPPERRQVAVLFTDITEAKRTEAALRESDRWFRQLADSMPQIVWTARPDGYLDYYNRRWYEFINNDLGYGDSGWLPILHPDDRQPCLDHWLRCLQTGEPYQFEFRLDDVRHPGNYRWFLARASAFRNEQNAILKWFGTCTDIHDQKTEAERLEKLVRERTRELQTANAELERSNLDLMQFASVASHDLKEPLRKIQAFGNILTKRLDGKLDPGERDYFGRIIGASHRMQALVEDVLSLSKLSSRDVAYAPVDLNGVVARIIDDLEITIREKGATVRVDNLPHLKAVPGQMHQLFQNLISNALKFTRNHPPEVNVEQVPLTPELRAELKLPHDGYAVVEVRDNGIGFEPQYRERIFGMFQRLNGRAEYAGTGIGLTICRRIAENHGGFITADGEPGRGATFRVVLPVRQG